MNKFIHSCWVLTDVYTSVTCAFFKIQIMSTTQKVLLCPILVSPALPSRGNHSSDLSPAQLVWSVLELHIKGSCAMHSFAEEFSSLGATYWRCICALRVSVPFWCWVFQSRSEPIRLSLLQLVDTWAAPRSGYYKWRCYEHSCTNFFVNMFLFLLGEYLGVKSLGRRVGVYLFL